CGKTTTLRIVAGLERPDAGHVRLGGRSMDGVAPEDRDVAMVFQNGGLYPHMTVRANLEFPLRMRRVPASSRLARARAAAELVGIAHLIDRRPGALSGGEHQRVALAKAMVREPACFLLDEPLASLDLGLRLRLRSELKALHARLGRTTILVTHDQEEAMALGDRLAVLRNGRLQQVARPLEIYRQPANRFVAGFIGAPPMNFIEGMIERADGEVRLRASGLVITLPPSIDGRAAPASSAVLGVRPESLRFAERPERPAIAVAAKVEVVEPLGDRTDVVCTLENGQRMVARTSSGEAPAAGASVTLCADGADVRLFEAGPDGRALR
ncbi:MAG: ABC transporter ATP-binding protein, partial [Phycisphaerales bacterium]|nr:ABC transporter ATP-binding protein [Phycisphaerales bacterium]